MPLSIFRGWLPRDRAMAVALEVYEQSLCPSCGVPHELGMDKTASHQWVAGLPVRCHSCTAMLIRAEEYADASQRSALRFPVHRDPSRTMPGSES